MRLWLTDDRRHFVDHTSGSGPKTRRGKNLRAASTCCGTFVPKCAIALGSDQIERLYQVTGSSTRNAHFRRPGVPTSRASRTTFSYCLWAGSIWSALRSRNLVSVQTIDESTA